LKGSLNNPIIIIMIILNPERIKIEYDSFLI
jgi:hypothetical protein